jgi:ParB-like chromosome segregation protein Spo0J
MPGIKEQSSGRSDVFKLNPALIQEEPGWNVRVEGPELDAHIRGLANSIKEIGVQQSLTVYMKGEIPVLTDGHLRLCAVRLAISEGAEIKTVPVQVEARYCNEADRVLSLLTRNSGKPLTPLEQAEVVKRLLGFGWVRGQITARTGMSSTNYDNLLCLGAAPAAVTEMVKNNEVSATTAVKVIKQDGHTEGTETLKTAVAKANQEGKTKATAKHLPKKEVKQKVVPGLEGYTFWEQWGPKLKTALEEIRDADSQDELQQKIVAGSAVLKGMGVGP